MLLAALVLALLLGPATAERADTADVEWIQPSFVETLSTELTFVEDAPSALLRLRQRAIVESAATGQSVDLAMDPNQPFAPLTSSPGTYGFLTSLTLSSALATDRHTKSNPGASSQNIAVVGSCEKFTWSGGASDGLSFVCYVSANNAKVINAFSSTTLKTTSTIRFGFVGYSKDTAAANKWFTAAQIADNTQGLIIPTGGVKLVVNPAPFYDPAGLLLSKVSFTVYPVANSQISISLAQSSTKSLLQPWGLRVG